MSERATPRRARPTIHDVARKASVSPTTVSHTFSGNGTVAAATRERVRRAAAALGYRPDVLASSLRNNRLGVIALVLRTLEDNPPEGIDYVLQFAGAAAVTAMKLGYGLMLVADPTAPGAPATAMACDGFVVTEPVQDDPLVTILQNDGIPCVAVGRVPGRDDVPALDIFTGPITDRVLERLRAGGARRIALLTGTTPNAWNLDTEAAYLAWARRHRRRAFVIRRPERSEIRGGREAVDELFDQADPPDAIYCLTGEHAAGALERLLERGTAVPGDVQVLCGSDAMHVRVTSPQITAVDLQPELLAQLAVTRLINQLDGADHPEPAQAATGLLVERGSTNPRRGDPARG